MSSRSPTVVRVARSHPTRERPLEVFEGPGERPDPEDVERWLGVARARLEGCLSTYDADLVEDVDPCLAAERGVRRFMAWCRRSAAALVTVRGSLVVDDDLRTRERIHWDREAREAISRAEVDPNGVERFLRLWLAVVHDAVSTGYASLHGDPTAW